MEFNITYNKYKIDKITNNKNELKNYYLLVDDNYDGFFIGKIKDDVEVNPLNMDRVLIFYKLRKSDIQNFKEELSNLSYLQTDLIDFSVRLQLNNKTFIYRSETWKI